MDDELASVLLKCHFCMEHVTQTVHFRSADSCGRSFTLGSSAAATSLPQDGVVEGKYLCDGCNNEYRVEIRLRGGVFDSVSHAR